ncbi:hypothetical protein HHI36_007885 [Cryptolaemus montrouzieri]|uniref:Uncharacterized protein n=1 Tax=Cryptolaemus montrouzieri TaxID=559131 RepID=A0ABD2MQW3_9CUCU
MKISKSYSFLYALPNHPSANEVYRNVYSPLTKRHRGKSELGGVVVTSATMNGQGQVLAFKAGKQPLVPVNKRPESISSPHWSRRKDDVRRHVTSMPHARWLVIQVDTTLNVRDSIRDFK